MRKTRFIPLIMLAFFVFALPLTGHAESEKDFETALTKGTYALQNDNLSEAVLQLQTAVKLRPENHAARLLLGMTQARHGEHKASRSNLLKALRFKRDDQRTLYELGLSFLKAKDVDEARDFFTHAAEVATDPKLTTAARNYLAKLPKKDARGKFRGTINSGVQHDSNVILEPDNPIISAEHNSDWRELVLVNLQYIYAPGKKHSSTIGYRFYQNIHNRLDEFNTQQHRFSLQGEFHLSPTASLLGRYRLPRTYLDNNLYSNVHTLGVGLKFKTAPNNRLEALFTHDRRRFFNTTQFSTNNDRSGDVNRLTLNDRFSWQQGSDLIIAYAYERDKTNQSFWDYHAHQGSLAIMQKFSSVTTGAKALVQTRSYHERFPGFSDRRDDTMQTYSLDFVWNVAENWNISISDVYTINKSDLSFFTYKRNIFGLFVRATL